MLFFVKQGCPNCRGIISDERLSKGSVCEKCLQNGTSATFSLLCNHLKKENILKNLAKYCEVEKKINYFKSIFKKIINNTPSSLQINWAKRFFLGESFAIIAPTGTGKSTFGLIVSLFSQKKSLIILPTKVLVEQIEKKLLTFIQKAFDKEISQKKVLAYKGKKKEKELIETGNFDIFVCTASFFHKNFELLKTLDFSFIFIDDVDSFLKNGKNVDNLFLLLGFTEHEIKLALQRNKEKEDYLELERIKEKNKTLYNKQLIISSATLKPKTNRVMLFQNLLGFEITRFVSTLRKIVDTYIPIENPSLENLFETTFNLVKTLGQGGLIFVEESYRKETVENLTKFLKSKEVRAISYLEVSETELLYLLESGEAEIAVGLCHLGNPLVRGLDLPEVLKYAIFLGVPKHLISLSKERDKFVISISPKNLHSLLLSLLPVFDSEEEKLTAMSYINYLKRYLTLSEERLQEYEVIYKKAIEIKEFIENKLNDSVFIQKLKEKEEVFLETNEKGEYFIVIGNATAYIQASGRVSRLTTKGLLPGLSIILVDNFKALNSLKKRLKFFIGDDVSLKETNIKEVKKIYEQILEERKNLKAEKKDFKNYLIIVESPHKAKTIANFFGKPSVRRLGSVFIYEIPTEDTLLSVCASLGHVFNLSRKEGIFGVLHKNGHFYPVFSSIKIDKDTGEQFVDEEIGSSKNIYDKGEIIATLRHLAFCSDKTFIASDPDAEGEKIAYDIFINLKPFQSDIKRLEFHEVTKRALEEALKNPHEINLNRVKAQLARRVADRWVGFSLSQELWKTFKRKTLSAGRVQTPVLGWIIKRAEEAKKFKYKITFILNEHYPFSLEVEDKKLAEKIKEELPKLKVSLVKEWEEEISPPPPYTTDTILEDAFHFFKFTTSQTMDLLQELFETGLITYHRTDSTRISEIGRYQVAKPYIQEHLGEDYFFPREWYSEGAHEGIRPTKPWDVKELKLRVAHGLISLKKPNLSFKLYDIIFRRFMASQIKKTKVKKAVLLFKVPSYSWEEKAIIEILSSGFDKIWKNFSVLPLKEILVEKISIKNIEIAKIPKVFLYNQGTLIQEMKKRGLGRPSTYAEIVSTLLNRRYVYELKTGGLVPTSLGKQVYQFLEENFKIYVSEEFTKELEFFMDEVENKGENWETICIKLLPLLKELKIC